MQVPEGTKIRVFQNCVEAEYFEGSSEYAGYKRALDKIAIISNHIQQELLELKEKMGGYYQVDLIGLGYRTEQVNAEFLQQYDLVITIEEPYRGVLQWAFRFMFMIIWEVPDI